MRLRRLEQVLRRALRGPCELPRGSRLMVAVSGGADSTALLVALASLAREFDLALTAAHLHHGLRGADADADHAYVVALAKHLHVPLIAARWDTRARMRREGLSGEAGLRVLRRRFLRAAAARAGAIAIATAHTADDQMETLLMRLARGTGAAGLGGMAPRRGAWLKPLLGATRHDVERDLTAAGIAWREDASNAGDAYLRNRVRHGVVPALLAALGPGTAGAPSRPAAARAALARRVAAAADSGRETAAVIARLARAQLSRRSGPDGRTLATAGLARLPRALRHAVLAAFWRRLAPASSGLPGAHLAQLDAVLRRTRPHGEVALPLGWRAVRTASNLRFEPPGERTGRPSGSRRHSNARLRRTGGPVRS